MNNLLSNLILTTHSWQTAPGSIKQLHKHEHTLGNWKGIHNTIMVLVWYHMGY